MTEQQSAPSLASLIGAYKSPHEVYDGARQRDPVSFDPTSNVWIVTSHGTTKAILADERFSSELTPGNQATPPSRQMSFLQAAIEKQILFTDGERHRRVQKIILRESARTMHETEPALRALAERLLDAPRARGTIDLVKDFALPYTLETICRMVGVPIDDPQTLANLAQWSSTFANVTSGYLRVPIREVTLLGDYFRALVTTPGAVPGGVIGAFIKDEVFHDEDDLIANCMMVFAAGRITTQKVLADGLPLLFDDWQHWRSSLGNGPGVSRQLAEELLRLVTPTRYLARRAVDDVDLSALGHAGKLIRQGDKVILFLEAANRDPAAFTTPHTLDAARQPNAHIAFGHGPHRCPGASIARLEIQVALETLLATFDELRPDPGAAPVWDANPNLGGFSSYPCLCR